MAMIICKECGKEVSDKANNCPNCGCPINLYNLYAQPQETHQFVDEKPKKKKNSALSTWSAILALFGCTTLIAVILAIIDLCKNDKDKKHGGSIFALIMAALYVFVLVMSYPSDSGASDEVLSMSESEFKSSCQTMTYDELFRNIDDNEGKYVKFKGEISQVVYDGDYSSQYLIAITESDFLWTDNVYVELSRDKVSDKFLEGDIVAFYGECKGTYSYTSVLGQSIEVPEIYALYMDLNN